ncbi:hypothetical protein KMW28_00130 [Flammeovirga yaeyamensis]|uniref:Uncharacterized protein n=1 Tax=Flammeovirga yaeyamensis TaxID=367791 RepID=A0AAX1N801_9BACT|nr:glycosyltransferase family 9 protein [Flammeovirga yaeyamensis]MBB3700603.1 ADP-heptose:LPS heptosyltransferase [Flammeovirga yaeyamensis]NMF37719.1 glycosyltransferase family 9 protein [Flammeovirga yaeyamensis]QWG02028.1 hypothetical protein KMW28_00130 [Flammeovirga yaeyamensis]
MIVQRIKKIVISGNSFLKDFGIGIQILPILKKYNENLEIIWLGTEAQKSIAEHISLINTFITEADSKLLEQSDALLLLSENNELSKQARDLKIENRIGGKYSWRYNRRLTKAIDLSKSTALLEAYFQLLTAFDIPLEECYTSTNIIEAPEQFFRGVFKKEEKNFLFYPYRDEEHRAWPGIRYFEIIEALPKYENNYIVAGTEMEGKALKLTSPELFRAPSVKDYTEIEDLEEGLALIAKADQLITYNNDMAHFAYAMGVKVLVISAATDIFYLHNDLQKIVTNDASCIKCVGDKACECMKKLKANDVLEAIN